MSWAICKGGHGTKEKQEPVTTIPVRYTHMLFYIGDMDLGELYRPSSGACLRLFQDIPSARDQHYFEDTYINFEDTYLTEQDTFLLVDKSLNASLHPSLPFCNADYGDYGQYGEESQAFTWLKVICGEHVGYLMVGNFDRFQLVEA